MLTSKQMAALPSLLSIRRAKIKLNGHPIPPHSDRGVRVRPVLQAFVERKKVYVQERREMIHIQKGMDPCVPFQGLRNWQGTENIAGKTTMSPAPSKKKQKNHTHTKNLAEERR